MLNEILKHNKEFVKNYDGEKLSHIPQKHIAILTCMDCRLTGFLENAIGIGRGDAKIIRNAGNTIVGLDAIRSIAAATINLECEEVYVIGHTDCGMVTDDKDAIIKRMLNKGIKQEDIDKIDVLDWLGTIEDEEINVIESVKLIRNSPFIPKSVPIYGLMIDIVTGELKVVIEE